MIQGGAEVLTEVDSEYTRMSVRQLGPLRGLYFHHSGEAALQSAINVEDPSDLPIAYQRYMSVGLAYLPRDPARMLIVGLGAGRSAAYHKSHVPRLEVHVAEVDREVIRLAGEYFGVSAKPDLQIHNEDGRVFLQRSDDAGYDLVLLDAFSHNFAPFHLTTREFYEVAERKLSAGGVVIQNVVPTIMLFGSTVSTMEAVFDHVDAYEASGNVILVGYNGPQVRDEDLVVRARSAQARLKTRYELPLLVSRRGSILPEFKGKVLTDDYSPSEILAAQPAVAKAAGR